MQNTLVRIMAPIFCSVCAIQKLLVLLNSLWISVCDDTLDIWIKDTIWIRD